MSVELVDLGGYSASLARWYADAMRAQHRAVLSSPLVSRARVSYYMRPKLAYAAPAVRVLAGVALVDFLLASRGEDDWLR